MNYFRARVEMVFNIGFPNEGGSVFFSEVNSPSVTCSQIFRSSQYFGFLSNAFGYFKLTGLLIEVVPQSINFTVPTNGFAVLLGFGFGQTNSQSYNALAADNNTLLLGSNTNSRRYISTWNSIGWKSTKENDEAYGLFSVASNVNGPNNRAPSWSVRLSLYLAFKKSNI
jgi:hypothetical protein